MSTTLIHNGRIVNADRTEEADLLIDGEKIREIAPALPITAADRVIDAAGMLLFPGGIDVHTHLDMPFGGTTSSDDFETGTRAAAFGGTTTLVDFAIQARGTKMRDALRHLVEESRQSRDHRLRSAHDRDRSAGRGPGGHGLPGGRGRGQLQALHGVSGSADGGRRHHLQGVVPHLEERCADLHARRERQRDRRDRAAGIGGGKDGAGLSRPDAPGHGRGGSGASRDRDG